MQKGSFIESFQSSEWSWWGTFLGVPPWCQNKGQICISTVNLQLSRPFIWFTKSAIHFPKISFGVVAHSLWWIGPLQTGIPMYTIADNWNYGNIAKQIKMKTACNWVWTQFIAYISCRTAQLPIIGTLSEKNISSFGLICIKEVVTEETVSIRQWKLSISEIEMVDQ